MPISYVFNPFTGNFDAVTTVPVQSATSRTLTGGQTLTILDTYCVVVSDYFDVADGTLILEGDADLAVI